MTGALETAMPFIAAARRAAPDLDLSELAVPSAPLLSAARALAEASGADVAFYRHGASAPQPSRSISASTTALLCSVSRAP